MRTAFSVLLLVSAIAFGNIDTSGQKQPARPPNPCPTPAVPSGDTACFFGSGCLDTSFGTNGVRTIPPLTGSIVHNIIHVVEVQADGKIVGVGSIHDSSTSTNDDFLIVRLNTDGSFDTSFGDIDPGNPLQRLGYKTDNFSTNQSYPGDSGRALTIQPDGKILVGGSTYPEEWIVVRYNTDGTRDTTFGTNGVAKPGFGSNVAGLAMQSDGKILAAGPSSFTVMRLNPNGTLDTTFGSGGVVSANPSTTSRGRGSSTEIAIQIVSGEERIVLGGYGFDATTKQQENNAKNKFALMRFLPSGAIDNSFGTAGRVMTAFFSGSDSIYSITADSQNRIVAAGQVAVTNLGCTDGDAGFARYTLTGALDTSFSGDGKAYIDIYNWGNHVVDVETQIVSDGVNYDKKIVGFGPTWPGSHFSLVRLNSDGNLDATFGPGTFGPGRVTLNIGESEAAYSATIQADNRILVTGGSQPSNNIFFARYLP